MSQWGHSAELSVVKMKKLTWNLTLELKRSLHNVNSASRLQPETFSLIQQGLHFWMWFRIYNLLYHVEYFSNVLCLLIHISTYARTYSTCIHMGCAYAWVASRRNVLGRFFTNQWQVSPLLLHWRSLTFERCSNKASETDSLDIFSERGYRFGQRSPPCSFF